MESTDFAYRSSNPSDEEILSVKMKYGKISRGLVIGKITNGCLVIIHEPEAYKRSSGSILGAIAAHKNMIKIDLHRENRSNLHQNLNVKQTVETSNDYPIVIIMDEKGKTHEAIVEEVDDLNAPIILYVFGIFYIRSKNIFFRDD